MSKQSEFFPASFKLEDSRDAAVTTRVKHTYLLALLSIAILASCAYLANQALVNLQENKLTFNSNIARQRILTQQIGLLTLRISTISDDTRRTEMLVELLNAISEMKTAHQTLMTEEEQWKVLTSYKESEQKAYLNPPIDLDTRVLHYVSVAERVSGLLQVKIGPRHPDIVYLVSLGSESLFESLEYAATQYEAIVEKKAYLLRFYQFCFLFGILLVVILEGWFVFRPMVKRINRAVGQVLISAREVQAVVDTIGEGIVSIDQDGAILNVNHEVERLWQTGKLELQGQKIASLFNSNSEPGTEFTLPVGDWLELSAKPATGCEFPVEVHHNVIEVEGKSIGVIAVRDLRRQKRDQDEIKRSLEEKNVLLQEIHHRVKNNLQIVSSFLSLQSRNLDTPEAKALFKESKNRVDTMSLIHEELYKSKDLSTIDFGSYIRDLSSNLFRTYGVDRSLISLNLAAEEAYFDIDTAVPCGLILNELITNALEHAFEDQQPGEITITLRRDDDHTWLLVVSDNGKGMSDTFDISGVSSMGLRLVSALVSQIDGKLEINSQGGTCFSVRFRPVGERGKGTIGAGTSLQDSGSH